MISHRKELVIETPTRRAFVNITPDSVLPVLILYIQRMIAGAAMNMMTQACMMLIRSIEIPARICMRPAPFLNAAQRSAEGTIAKSANVQAVH